MARAGPSLRRLLGADVRRLLDEVAAAMPDVALAVVALDGDIAHATGDGLEPPETAQPTRTFDLAPRAEAVGRLVVHGDAPEPLLIGLQRSISLLMSEALDKHDLARETLERYREINLLYRASETIGACLNPDVVPRLLLAESESVIPAGVALVLLRARDAWVVAETRGTAGDVEGLRTAASGLIASVAEAGSPDIAIWPAPSGGAPASALCVPIRAGEDSLGVVVLGRTAEERPFTAGDEKLLLGLAGQAGIAIERARLHEQETRGQRLEEELAVARRIQLTLLPARVPVVPGWTFAASYQAAREVGGDFYDFLDHALGERRLGIVIADVTGKGVPAALMMAYSRAVLRAESMAGRSPLEVLERTNRLFMQERQTRLFLSAFCAELDLETGRLVYANAGHDAPLLVEAGSGSARELDAPGVVLGAFSDMRLETRSVELAPGDSVVFYTDGVTEARDHGGRLFGDERLHAAVTAGGADAASVLASVTGAVAAFTSGAPQADDLTMVVVSRDAGPQA